MAKTAQDVLRLIKEEGIELIDLKFTDLHGKWQHLTVCQDLIEPESFTEGLAFDGSSIRGWKAINASDMAMVPDPSTAWIDPFYRHKDPQPDLFDSGSPHRRALRALPSRPGPESPGLPLQHRVGRHGLLRSRTGILPV